MTAAEAILRVGAYFSCCGFMAFTVLWLWHGEGWAVVAMTFLYFTIILMVHAQAEYHRTEGEKKTKPGLAP